MDSLKSTFTYPYSGMSEFHQEQKLILKESALSAGAQPIGC